MTRASRRFSLHLSIVSSLILTACGGSSSSGTPGTIPAVDTDSPVDADTDNPTDFGSAALSCISPDRLATLPISYFDTPNFEVFDDLFTIDTDVVGVTPAEVATLTAVPFAGSAFLAIELETLSLAFPLGVCDYEIFAANQCQIPLNPLSDVTLNAGVLSYTSTYDDLEVKMIISDSEYSSGSYQRTESDGLVVNMSWSRDSDGTERFNSASNEGASTEFVEFPDCSGNAARVFPPSNGEPGPTLSAFWSPPTSSGFSGTFEWCDLVEGAIQCTTFTRPK